MNLVSNLIGGLINVYIWILIISSLIGLFAPHIRHPLLNMAWSITNPPLEFIRKNMPFVVQGPVDFSPLVLIVGLQLIKAIF
jgi:YggT family protein